MPLFPEGDPPNPENFEKGDFAQLKEDHDLSRSRSSLAPSVDGPSLSNSSRISSHTPASSAAASDATTGSPSVASSVPATSTAPTTATASSSGDRFTSSISGRPYAHNMNDNPPDEFISGQSDEDIQHGALVRSVLG